MALSKQTEEIRSKGIGGSDVAAIMGLSKWKTAHELWLEKTGKVPPEKLDSQAVHFGNVLEDVVADEFSARTDFKLRRRNQTVHHKKYPELLANIDRDIVGEKSVLECKTSSAFMAHEWGEEMTEEFPDYYRVQVEHYMTVLGYETAYLAVLIGGNNFKHYFVERDPELAEILMDACLDFWEMVKADKAPDIDFEHDTTKDMLARKYPGTNGKTIILPDEIQPWHEVLQQTSAKINELEKVKLGCKNRIAEAMGEAAIGIVPSQNYQYKRRLQKRKETVQKATEFWVQQGSNYSPQA